MTGFALGSAAMFCAGSVFGIFLATAWAMVFNLFCPKAAESLADSNAQAVCPPTSSSTTCAAADDAIAIPTYVKPAKPIVSFAASQRGEPRWLPARDHAMALLRWLQECERTGEVTAREIALIYPEMCHDKFWAVRPWQTVATEFRKLTGGEKSYAWRNGERVRIYRIPALSSVALTIRAPERRAA